MLVIKDYQKGRFDGVVYIPNTVTHVWHVGDPMPALTGQVIEFQADGHELPPFLEALEKYSAKEKAKETLSCPCGSKKFYADSEDNLRCYDCESFVKELVPRKDVNNNAAAGAAADDGTDYCTWCGAWREVRYCVLPAQGKLSEIYPNGKSGYYCQACINKYKARKS